MILFGHQTGNPNAHHAALALKEAGLLGAYCTPWYPQDWELRLLRRIPGLGRFLDRLSRRRFAPLDGVPKIQGRLGEFRRLATRLLGWGDEGLSYEINDWMMKKLSREIGSSRYQAVYTYEDCAEQPFRSAKTLGKTCIYDMPIGYYGWWQAKETQLAKKYRDWLPAEGIRSTRWVRPDQKKREMDMADLVLAPSTFAAETIQQYFDKKVRVIPYGSDPIVRKEKAVRQRDVCRFLFAGTASVRKGVPFLLETWAKLGWRDAELVLAGGWQLEPGILKRLPRGVTYVGLLSRGGIQKMYQECDWLVHPSNFEGFSLSILEALGAGLPVVASTATGAADFDPGGSVILFEPECQEQLAASLLKAKKLAQAGARLEAGEMAGRFTWAKYRQGVASAVAAVGPR